MSVSYAQMVIHTLPPQCTVFCGSQGVYLVGPHKLVVLFCGATAGEKKHGGVVQYRMRVNQLYM